MREIPPSELFRILHMNQKTGALSLEFPSGDTRVSFREGCVINTQYREKSNQVAIFDNIQEREGRYVFITGLIPEEMRHYNVGII